MSRRRSSNAEASNSEEAAADNLALLTFDGESPASASASVSEEPPNPAAPADVAELVSIELPIGPYHDNQCRPGHVDLRLSPRQARALQRLRNGVEAHSKAAWIRRKDYSYADVVRWLLDQLPD